MWQQKQGQWYHYFMSASDSKLVVGNRNRVNVSTTHSQVQKLNPSSLMISFSYPSFFIHLFQGAQCRTCYLKSYIWPFHSWDGKRKELIPLISSPVRVSSWGRANTCGYSKHEAKWLKSSHFSIYFTFPSFLRWRTMNVSISQWLLQFFFPFFTVFFGV